MIELFPAAEKGSYIDMLGRSREVPERGWAQIEVFWRMKRDKEKKREEGRERQEEGDQKQEIPVDDDVKVIYALLRWTRKVRWDDGLLPVV